MMPNNDQPKFVVVGGGLGGALLAAYLGQAGYEVDLYEMRGDLRSENVDAGRSINLALSHRGICALERIGLADDVLKMAVPMSGRLIHAPDGHLTYQPYGTKAGHTINSISRSGLNVALLQAADRFENVKLHFNQQCTDVDFDRGAIELSNTISSDQSTATGDIIVSADGAFSAVRRAMQRHDRFNYRQDYLEHGYKELTIPAGPGGEWRLQKNVLHIWPRKSFMMIALPNADGSFTCTLFWPFEGPNSFAKIETEEDVMRFFQREFPDSVSHMPTLAKDYFDNPVGSLVTVRCSPWHVRGRAVLLGDACHAVVPFYGQGMNAAFEDVLVLSECMETCRPDWQRAFELYEQIRRLDVNVLADKAISNFVEMRDHSGSWMFHLKKKTERFLHALFPKWYIPLYTLMTFTHPPLTRSDATRAGFRDAGLRDVSQARRWP